MTLVAVLAVLVAILLLASAYLFFGLSALFMATAVVAVALTLLFLFRSAFILVNEMEVGVIFNRINGNFIRFIDSARHRHFDCYHFINPFTERLESTIQKGSQKAADTLKQARTIEGIPLAVGYAVSFAVDPFKIMPGLEPKMARALPKAASNIVSGKTALILKHIIEQKSINELYNAGALKKLEEEVREALIPRIEILGITGISPESVQIGPVMVPLPVEKALETAHERILHTETEVLALERLREVVHQFTATDMDRLAELERLRVIGERGTPIYLMPPLTAVHDQGRPANGASEAEW
jgi:regulator of protease activity HflC (stomatin/prohibitin superfamily)